MYRRIDSLRRPPPAGLAAPPAERLLRLQPGGTGGGDPPAGLPGPHVAGVRALGATMGSAPPSAARPTLPLQGAGGPPDGAPPAPGPEPAPSLPAEPLPEAPLVEPRVTVVVPPSPVRPVRCPHAHRHRPPAPARPSETARPQGPGGVQAAPARAPRVVRRRRRGHRSARAGPDSDAAPGARSAPTQTAPAPPATPTLAGPPQRQVTGQISAVDRRRRLFSVFSPDGNRTWQVRLADSTTLQQKDGRPRPSRTWVWPTRWRSPARRPLKGGPGDGGAPRDGAGPSCSPPSSVRVLRLRRRPGRGRQGAHPLLAGRRTACARPSTATPGTGSSASTTPATP